MDVDGLLGWYARVRRPLPWRETRDPYALLVSEVMLQQTQAAREVAEHDWPDDLTQLPGVGPYTAAAVGSFAWDRQSAAIGRSPGSSATASSRARPAVSTPFN